MTKTRKLTECGLLIAIAAVLNIIPFFSMPNGGSVTLASMVPIVLISLKHGSKWGILSGFAFSLIQMMTKFNTPPVASFYQYMMVVMLDYVIAFTVLGLACAFARNSKKPAVSVAVGTIVVCFLRFLCHFGSGILIWNVYAPEGQPVWLYSLTYNGGYMLVETIISTVVVVLLVQALKIKVHGSSSATIAA